MNNKKGTDKKSAPITQSNYSRLSSICLLLIIIGTIALVCAHFKQVDWAFYLSSGIAFSALIIQLEINALEMEEDDDEEL